MRASLEITRHPSSWGSRFQVEADVDGEPVYRGEPRAHSMEEDTCRISIYRPEETTDVDRESKLDELYEEAVEEAGGNPLEDRVEERKEQWGRD